MNTREEQMAFWRAHVFEEYARNIRQGHDEVDRFFDDHQGLKSIVPYLIQGDKPGGLQPKGYIAQIDPLSETGSSMREWADVVFDEVTGRYFTPLAQRISTGFEVRGIDPIIDRSEVSLRAMVKASYEAADRTAQL